ncbi:MAG TPA: gliding motility protein GldL [Flavobacterium sp.]|jgi:hypothetical protein
MKTKHAVIVFVLGMLLACVGALMKIMHWPGANMVLTVATVLEVVGGVVFLAKILSNPKVKEFMNW